MTKKLTITNIIIEELTADQKARVDKWVPKTKTTPAEKISGHVFSGDKTVIPVERVPIEPKRLMAPYDISSHLEKHGYEIHDYHAGLVKDKYGRQMKLGKALTATKAPEYVVKQFINDPDRSNLKSDTHEIVISRHPHDVAGMSTDRGWTSCMHMDYGPERSHLKADIQQGTHTAYLVKKGDHEIKNPIARINLKPMVSEGKHKILRPEYGSYGEVTDAFHETVSNWTKKHFPMKDGHITYEVPDSLYNDGMETKLTNHKALDKDTSAFHKLPHYDKWDMLHSLYKSPEERNLRTKLLNEHIEREGYGSRTTKAFIAQYGTDEHRDHLMHDQDVYTRTKVYEHGNDQHKSYLAHNETDGVGIRSMATHDIDYNTVSEHTHTIAKRIAADENASHDANIHFAAGAISFSNHPKLHDILEHAKDPRIRVRIAENTKSETRLNRMVNDPVKSVVHHAIMNPNFPTSTSIDVMKNHPDIAARRLASDNLITKDLSEHIPHLHPEVTHSIATTTRNVKTADALRKLNDPEVNRKLEASSRYR